MRLTANSLRWPATLLLLLVCSCTQWRQPTSILIPEAQEYFLTLYNQQVAGITARTQICQGGRTITTETEFRTEKTLFGIKTIPSEDQYIQNIDGIIIDFQTEDCRAIRNESGGFDIYSRKSSRKSRHVRFSEDALFQFQLSEWLAHRDPIEGETVAISLIHTPSMEEFPTEITIGLTGPVTVLGQTCELRELAVLQYTPIGRIKSIQYVDDHWQPVRQVTQLGGIYFEYIRCDRRQLPITWESSTIESMVVLTSPVRIRNMAKAESIRYRVKPRNGNQLDLPSTDYQRIVPQLDGSFRIEVVPQDPPAGVSFPYTGTDPEALAAMEATNWLESDSEIIQRLASKAVGRETDAAKAVEKIRSFVFWYLSTDPATTDTAAEIATAKKGTCKEYAKLMAAMCRSAGIPANVVSGYIYAGSHKSVRNAFWGHAWVQVYVGEKWHAVDPTRLTFWGLLNDHTVGHIATHIWRKPDQEIVDIADNLGAFDIVAVQQP